MCVVDVATGPVDVPRGGDELHRTLRPRHRRAPDATEGGLHQVDRGEVLPVHAEASLRLAVAPHQGPGGSRRHDPPGRQLVGEVGRGGRVHRAELATRRHARAHPGAVGRAEVAEHPSEPSGADGDLPHGQLGRVSGRSEDVGVRCVRADHPLGGGDHGRGLRRRGGTLGGAGERGRQLRCHVQVRGTAGLSRHGGVGGPEVARRRGGRRAAAGRHHDQAGRHECGRERRTGHAPTVTHDDGHPIDGRSGARRAWRRLRISA